MNKQKIKLEEIIIHPVLEIVKSYKILSVYDYFVKRSTGRSKFNHKTPPVDSIYFNKKINIKADDSKNSGMTNISKADLIGYYEQTKN